MKRRVEPTEVIRQAFTEMSKSEAAEMVALGDIRSYPEGKELCSEGEIQSTFYIIMDGQVRVTKTINEDEERFLCYLDPGDFFGEMALIHNAPRAATVTTTIPTSVLEISKRLFDDLVRRNASVSMAMIREVSRRLRENNDLAIEDLRMKAGELAAAYQQLAEVEYAKSEFLTVVAHELRTPLTVANGFLQVIRTHQMQGEALDSALDTVARNIQDIIAITNDVLFLQEMDFILSEFQPVDVGQIVTNAVEQLQARPEKSEVDVLLHTPSNVPHVLGDGKSLERAFRAIVDNAIKFSPNGGDVKVELGFDAENVWVKVSDNGVGIPKHALPRIFDRFFHLEEVGGNLFRGAGLGLSIARQVIKQHQGRIEVESELGKGSTFTTWLNVQPSKTSQAGVINSTTVGQPAAGR